MCERIIDQAGSTALHHGIDYHGLLERRQQAFCLTTRQSKTE
jgi:hypothetical protein